MAYGGPILVNQATDPSHPDSVTGTEVGNKRGVDVNLIGGEVNISSTSSSGGGYSTTGGDFTATPTTATKDVVIAGLPFTLDACTVVAGSAKVIDSSGNVSDIPDTNVTVSSSTITFTDKADNFAAGDTVCMSLAGPDKAYTTATDSSRSGELDPLDEHYINIAINTDTTNVTAATHYYPSSTGMPMDAKKDLSISGKLIDADGTLTLTVEMMNDEDTSSGDWIQVYGYDDKNNVVANSWTVTNGTLTFANSFNNANYNHVRVAVVASGATNTVIVKGRTKAL